jgi:hypothetical protein
MKIKSRDKNVDFSLSLYEWENPGKLRAQRSSNTLFLGCAIVFGAFLTVYAMRMSVNMDLEQQIETETAYTTNPSNIEQEEAQIELLDKITEINIYNETSEMFLEQLQNSDRFSRRWMEFFDTELVNAIGNNGSIQNFSYRENKMDLSCVATSSELPRQYARHLTNLLDEEGNPRFTDVHYTGFSESADEFSFNLQITLWESVTPEETPVPTESSATNEEE